MIVFHFLGSIYRNKQNSYAALKYKIIPENSIFKTNKALSASFHGHYKDRNSFSAGTVFIRLILMSEAGPRAERVNDRGDVNPHNAEVFL